MTGGLDVWVYLAASPLFGLTLTVAAYWGATEIQRRGGQRVLLNPVLVSIVLVGSVLQLGRVDYRTYFDGAQFVHFLLGPATVALAVPLHRELARIRQAALPVLVALTAGSLTAVGSAVGIASALGASPEMVVSMAPKSATAPVAMSVSEQLGGSPSLTMAFVVVTGLTGAVAGRLVLDLVRVRDWRARGFAVGVTSHGLGTARALQVNATAGTYAGLGLALNALATPVLLQALVAGVGPLDRLGA